MNTKQALFTLFAALLIIPTVNYYLAVAIVTLAAWIR